MQRTLEARQNPPRPIWRHYCRAYCDYYDSATARPPAAVAAAAAAAVIQRAFFLVLYNSYLFQFVYLIIQKLIAEFTKLYLSIFFLTTKYSCIKCTLTSIELNY